MSQFESFRRFAVSFPWTPWLHTRKRVAEIFVCVEHDHGAASQPIAHVSKNGKANGSEYLLPVVTRVGRMPYLLPSSGKRHTK